MWTKDDDAQALREGWKLTGEGAEGSFGPPRVLPLPGSKFKTTKAIIEDLQKRRRGECYHTNENGGMRFIGADGFATRALRELDRRKVAANLKQFPDVNGTFGAPMGRRETGDEPTGPCRLFKVKMVDGDYDDGGAYWGGGSGVEPLYCCRGEEFERVVRAKGRVHAFLKLRFEFPGLKLVNPVGKDILAAFEDEIKRGMREEDGTSKRAI